MSETDLELRRKRGREAARHWRERNHELDCKRKYVYLRRWRDSHRDTYRAIKNANHSFRFLL